MMEYPWAVPGAKVVCVDPSFDGIEPDVLVNRGIYTIKDVFLSVGTAGRFAGLSPEVVLYEVENPHSSGGGFAIERFRPLIVRSQEQDIALFRRIADAAPADLERAV